MTDKQRVQEIVQRTKSILRAYSEGRINRMEADVSLIGVGWARQEQVDRLLDRAKSPSSKD